MYVECVVSVEFTYQISTCVYIYNNFFFIFSVSYLSGMYVYVPMFDVQCIIYVDVYIHCICDIIPGTICAYIFYVHLYSVRSMCGKLGVHVIDEREPCSKDIITSISLHPIL